jgi:hypothetical protein
VLIEEGERSLATISIVATLYFKIENQFHHALAQAVIGRPLIAQNWVGFQAIIQCGDKVLDKVALVQAFSEHFDALQSAPFRHSSIFGYISFNHIAVIKQNISPFSSWCGGRYSSETIATRYGLDSPESNPSRGEIFGAFQTGPEAEPGVRGRSVVLTTHRLLVLSCKRVGATHPPPLCAGTGISWSDLDSKMVYKFSQSVSYCQFKQCVNHWLGDWRIGFEFPAWAQILFLFSISSRVDTNWVPRIIGQEEKQ